MCLIWLISIKKTKFTLTKNIKYISELLYPINGKANLGIATKIPINCILNLYGSSHLDQAAKVRIFTRPNGIQAKNCRRLNYESQYGLQVEAQLVVFVLILLWFDYGSRIFPLVLSSLKLFRVLTRYTFCNLTLQNNFIVQIFIWPFEIRLNLPPIF